MSAPNLPRVAARRCATTNRTHSSTSRTLSRTSLYAIASPAPGTTQRCRLTTRRTFSASAATLRDQKSFRDQIGQNQSKDRSSVGVPPGNVSETASSAENPGPVDAEGRKKNFHGQVWQSMYERVQREKEEQKRFQGMGHEMGGVAGGALGTLFVILFSAGVGYWFGQSGSIKEDISSTIPLDTAIPPVHDTSRSTLQTTWVELRNIVGEGNISEDEIDRRSHAGSEWSSHQIDEGQIPFAIVRPASTEEVSKIMKICHNRKVPVTGYSGGTSLEGHYAATRGGICIDFSRMDNILQINKEDMDVIVQPAVGWESLNEELSTHNLFFPPDPGPGAQIGGMIGTGCSGTNAYRYGTMKDWVLSLTVVLADGTIIKTRQRPRKSSAGYDLTRMFIGSEGTLGLVTEAVLKLTPKPAHTSVAVCSFPSVRRAADCVAAVVGAGVPIAAIEILDDVQMKCINDAGATSRTWTEAPTLFFKFAGTPTSVKEHVAMVQKLARKEGSKTFEFAKSAQEADELWSARKEALWSVMAKKREGDHVWTTDVAVPISRLAEIIEVTKGDIQKSGLFASIVGHVGDGNFHSILLYNDSQRKIAEDVVHRMVQRAIQMEGTATGEHGVGLVKRDALPYETSFETVAAMRKLKKAFDPLCLLNCDKIVRVEQPRRGEVVGRYD